MNTKKELGNKYYNQLVEIKSYTNDSSEIDFALEHILKKYVPAKVLKVWIARTDVQLKELKKERA
tara:strand:+ start:407 stop:601 length:195 start_codon:yes stop_codon:yes gene_type:complete